MKLEIVLDRDEIQAAIPYSMICETRYGSVWNTMRRKRRWKEEFPGYKGEKANAMCRQAYNWTLKTGVPEQIRMSASTYDLWQELAAFCASL